ncbi:MAG TPA: YceI family protein [Streptosporangiaceae bacterium]|jgi:polyisoprenoid-binding protein YceI|nr:YceI family protein [Streptosporangiaceae bacterium]
MRRHWLRWLIAGIIVVVVLAVGGPFLYIHFFNGSTPAALTLPTASSSASTSSSPGGAATASTAASGSLAGTYSVGSGSAVGYRVNEVLVGQSTTAVGRTSSVTGHLTIAGTTATAATFSVPMDTVLSDKSQRNAQFDGRIMDVAQYPTGTFTLTHPIDLAPLPATGVIKSYTATGKLTLHGATRTVTFTLTAERSTAKDGGTQIEVAGDIPVLFSDYNIQNPSVGGFVTTQDHGLLEFLLVFSKA